MRPHHHQHPKTAAPIAPERSSPNSTPTQHPRQRRTRPRAPCRHVLSPAPEPNSTQNRTCASTPKCMPPSSQPSILQNNFPSSLEVYSSWEISPRGQLHLQQQHKTALAPPPQIACPLAPAGNLRKLRPQRQQHLKQHPKQSPKTAASAPQTACGHQSCKNAPAPSPAPQTAPQTGCPPAVHQRLKLP